MYEFLCIFARFHESSPVRRGLFDLSGLRIDEHLIPLRPKPRARGDLGAFHLREVDDPAGEGCFARAEIRAVPDRHPDGVNAIRKGFGFKTLLGNIHGLIARNPGNGMANTCSLASWSGSSAGFPSPPADSSEA